MKFNRLVLSAAAAAILMSVPASAQSVDESTAGIARTGLISANPIGLLFEWYNGEVERAINSTTSVAVAATRFDFFDNDTYTAVDGIVRYYPAGRAIRGFSVGASVGFANVEVDDCFECADDSETVFTLGVRGDYVWVLGRDQRFAVAAGIGAKRLFVSDIGEAGLPIGRLSIGYAF